MTDHEALIWAAGFLEGEESFSARKDGRWSISCGQNDPEPLHRLIAIFGGNLSFRQPGSIYFTKSGAKSREGWWGWEIHGRENILRITREVLPFMSYGRRVRIPWAQEAIESV